MTTYNTGNPLGSAAAKDLYDNAQNFDHLSNDRQNKEWNDRFGVSRLTWWGMEENLKTAITNLGWNPIGTFQGGAVITAAGDVIQDETNDVWYRWDDLATIPKTVPPGSTPDSTGGIGDGKWIAVDISDVLRKELASENGAVQIGAKDKNGDPTTVQDELSEINDNIYEIRKSPLFDHTVQSIVRYGPIAGENGDAISAATGIVKGNLYSSGIAVDEETGEIFIVRTNYVALGTVAWVDIYDANFIHQKTVSMGQDYPEGMVIGYVNGVRKAAIGMSTGYAVYTLPVTSSIVDMSTLTPEFTQPSTNHLSQLSSYGDKVIIWNNNLSQLSKVTRGLFSVFDKTNFLSTANPTRISFLTYPTLIAGSSSADAPAVASKCQGSALTPWGISLVGGQLFDSQSIDTSPAKRLRITDVNYSGDTLVDNMFSSADILNKLTELGYTQVGGLPLRVFEAEGIVYSDYHGLLVLYSSWNAEFVMRVGVNLINKNTLTLKSNNHVQTMSKGFYSALHYGRPIDPATGVLYTTVDDICNMMDRFGIREYTCSAGTNGLSVAGDTYTGNAAFKIINADDNWFEVNVWAMNSADARIRYISSGASPRSFSKRVLSYGGTAITSAASNTLQISPQNFALIRWIFSGVSSNTALSFYNDNGAIGSITCSGSTTSFNTTSDERRKTKKGPPEENIVQKIVSAVDAGAVQMAVIDNEKEPRLMFMAQTLMEYFPDAVTAGGDDPKESPWVVDYSSMVPHLMYAIYLLAKQ